MSVRHIKDPNGPKKVIKLFLQIIKDNMKDVLKHPEHHYLIFLVTFLSGVIIGWRIVALQLSILLTLVLFYHIIDNEE